MKVGFEPRISGFSNDRSANCATSTAFSSNHCSSPKKSLMLGTAVAFHNIYIKQFFSIFGSFNYFFIFCWNGFIQKCCQHFFRSRKEIDATPEFFFFLSRRQREKYSSSLKLKNSNWFSWEKLQQRSTKITQTMKAIITRGQLRLYATCVHFWSFSVSLSVSFSNLVTPLSLSPSFYSIMDGGQWQLSL